VRKPHRSASVRGNAIICDATLDGTYLGGGFSWGYETLGANEALGRSIIDVVRKLQSGEPIEIGSARTAPGAAQD